MENFKVDIVYLWVDGSDPEWQKKRSAYIPASKARGRAVYMDAFCEGRYINNDELRYSLRSIEKYANWVRKIFIITDNQIPAWLDISNPRIEIINQNELLPVETLPCFSSEIIEYFLYKIPDLSEHFIYANDDMFLNKNISPGDFFCDDGFPIVRLERKYFGYLRYKLKYLLSDITSAYKKTHIRASDEVYKRLKKRYWGFSHHNMDSYRKSDYKAAMENVFSDVIAKTMLNHVRSANGLQRIAILYYALAVGHGHLRYVTQKESLAVQLYKMHKMNDNLTDDTMFFCLNDDEHSVAAHRVAARSFLDGRFPCRSEFEI
jgi:hypothetical protein